MTQLIEDFLNTVYTNFLGKEWCDLNSTALNVDNYEDECQQEYYLLKYFPAYLAEYYDAYSELFKIYNKKNINILSIGCGAGIDYYALNTIKDKPMIDYFGIDLIDWKYRPDFSFAQLNINDLDSEYFDNVDLIVLPKILTELEDEEINHLATIIVNSNLPNEIYFLNSYITDDSNDSSRVDGISKFEIICEELIKNNFSISGDNSCLQYTYFKGNAGIRKYIPTFVYPNDKKDFLCNLKSNCIELEEFDDDCMKCNIGEYPMMNSKYIAYNVIKFVKNDN